MATITFDANKIRTEADCEHLVVEYHDDGRVYAVAFNQGGFDCTRVDVAKLISFVRAIPVLSHVLDSGE